MKNFDISGLAFTIGGALVTGWAPTQWPSLSVPAVTIGVIFLVVGVLRLAVRYVPAIFGQILPQWSVSLEFRDWAPFRSLIPMNVAVQRAIDILDDRVAGKTARLMSVSPESYMWHALVNEGAVQLWGSQPPSKRLKPLPPSLSVQGTYYLDQNSFRLHGAKVNSYENMHMLRRDFRAGVKRLKRWDADIK